MGVKWIKAKMHQIFFSQRVCIPSARVGGGGGERDLSTALGGRGSTPHS